MQTTTTQPTPVPTSFLRVVCWFIVATIAVSTLLILTLDRIAVEKIVTILALPCGVIWYMLMYCLVVAFSTKQRGLAVAVLGITLLYTLCGSGLFASYIVRQMEQPFAEFDPAEQSPLDVVVLLGGGASLGGNGRFQGNQSADRVVLAAELYHAGVAPKLICTGKGSASLGHSHDPSNASMQVLQALGVPRDAIEIGGGRNTAEEMINLKKRFGETDARIGLVTSAWHLPRALRLAKKNGLDPVPLPADFMAGPEGPQNITELIMSVIPQAENFQSVTRICRERMAWFVGR